MKTFAMSASILLALSYFGIADARQPSDPSKVMCITPSAMDFNITQTGSSLETLYASVTNAHCVNAQPLTSFTKSVAFKLRPTCSGAYYNVNIYKGDKVSAIAHVYLGVNITSTKDKYKMCNLVWRRDNQLSGDYDWNLDKGETQIDLDFSKNPPKQEN